MPINDLLQSLLYFGLVLAVTPPLGAWLARLFGDGAQAMPGERRSLRLLGAGGAAEQTWQRYAAAVLLFNLVGFLLLYAILRLQHALPWNPQGMAAMEPALAFNTAISFVTNTNWQAYSGEVSLSYFSQMAGLTTQNFVSAGSGIAVGFAVIRGFLRREARTLGNFWQDLLRSVLFLLLPLSLVTGLLLAGEGVPQNLGPYVPVETLEGGRQLLPQGPAAGQIAIKQLGTNGGGFFGLNSAHPYENPTPLSNLVQMLAILAIPAAFTYAFGRLAGEMRQGWALFAAMAFLLLAGFAVMYWAEMAGTPALAGLGIDAVDGNLEGKEVRFGVVNSTLWASATTAASNGSVNAMHDSFSPLGGAVALFNILTGEIVFGGVGSGFYGMLLYVVLTVFLAGLMVGRTPEYLGKKIEAREVKLAVLALLAMPIGVLGGTALGVVLPEARAALQEGGPHGLSELFYAYASATGNNGSAFGGFGAAAPIHATLQGLAMLLGRYAFIVPLLAIAGSLAAKRRVAAGAGTFPTHGPLFVTLLVAVIVFVGFLTFLPALALGPLAEQVSMLAGQSF